MHGYVQGAWFQVKHHNDLLGMGAGVSNFAFVITILKKNFAFVVIINFVIMSTDIIDFTLLVTNILNFSITI